jgi:hypothetical protein
VDYYLAIRSILIANPMIGVPDCKSGTADCKSGTADCESGTAYCKSGTAEEAGSFWNLYLSKI